LKTLLEKLNPEQKKAVTTTQGPLMIIAGAGSGKTRVITYRIAYLIHQNLCRPEEILALTFTNKAAQEMRARIEGLLGNGSTRGLWIGTFHSNFARLLRSHASKIGYENNFSIYDADDSKKIIKDIMSELGIATDLISPNAVQSIISKAKNTFVLPARFAETATDFVYEKVADVYLKYQEHLKKNNSMDFDDLLINPIELFNYHPDILQAYQQRFKYLMIDEYQDTNRAQYVVSKQMASAHQNLCVVGDDAQSIYSWRGADISNILGFQKDYPQATVCRLQQNYRSTQTILKVANAVIKNNKNQLEKTIFTENEIGDPVVLFESQDERREAEKIAITIRDLKLSKGFKNHEFSVFYRTNAQSRALEDAMRYHGLAYQVFGSVSFYKRKEIKDIVAYLRFIMNSQDEESLLRIINFPARGIGDVSLKKIKAAAEAESLSVFEVISRALEYDISPRLIGALNDFRFLIEHLQSLSAKESAYEVVAELLRKTRMLELLKEENTTEANARYDNLQEFLSLARDFTDHNPEDCSLSSFIQNVSLSTDQDNVDDADSKVTLMTVHSAKGLEFPVVFVTGLEEKLFPLNPDDSKELEEERRLFYVALTRAEKMLYVSYAKNRYRFGQLLVSVRSRFLDELDSDVVVTESGTKLWEKRQREQERSRYDYSSYQDEYSGSTYNNSWKKGPGQSKPKPQSKSSETQSEGNGLKIGMKVQHKLFGVGKVIALQGSGDAKKAKVFFDRVGEKTLVVKFANLNPA